MKIELSKRKKLLSEFQNEFTNQIPQPVLVVDKTENAVPFFNKKLEILMTSICNSCSEWKKLLAN
jgi:hypothetical protein